MHGLHLSNNLSFKQICDKKAIFIQYSKDPQYSDVEVSDNTLVKRSNDDPDGYWPWKGPNVKMPDYSRSDAVEDTELISTFIERNKITDVTWVKERENLFDNKDVSVASSFCDEHLSMAGYECVHPHQYAPEYIWTASTQQQGLAM